MGGKKGPAILIGFGEKPGMGGEESDTGALAGTALAKALKSGDGAAIYSAFQDLMRECEAGKEEPEEDESDMAADEAPY